jgi:succinate-semialdehyde dehydrogenase / glutarate-semialdehyde dehydrogenase
MSLESINPANGRLLAQREEQPAAEVGALIESAHQGFQAWRNTPSIERAAALHRVARGLRRERDRWARLMTDEMGKPLLQARAEVDKCIVCCEYFADYAADFLGRETIRTETGRSYVVFQPLGVILAVMPWNFPFWQVFRAAAPALMAGNAMVLKHASNVTGCGLACEEVFQGAGLPEGLFRTVVVGSARVHELVAHPRIKAVTLTGSSAAGSAVAAQAGALVKKTVLELGGSDPYLVLEDADLPAAVEACVASRLINSGQSCIAAKRFIVAERVRETFEKLFVRRMQEQQVGDPLDPATTVGPLARCDLRDDLHRQVRESVAQGARLHCGGEIPGGEGAYYPPTVLTNARKGMPVWDEETFGPVAALCGVAGELEAIQAANDTAFGLGAAIFTRDRARGERVAAQIEAGCVFVNDFVRSDPRLPFGGIKLSGYGRELSAVGLREFVNIKTVWVG